MRVCVLLQVYEILARTVYGKRKRAEVGVDRLVNEGVYTAAFPLHEVRNYLSALYSDVKLVLFSFTNQHVSFHRAPLSFPSLRSVLTSWTRGRFFTTTGPAGANGTSTNHWTTSGSTLERRLHSTLPGWVNMSSYSNTLGWWDVFERFGKPSCCFFYLRINIFVLKSKLCIFSLLCSAISQSR